MATVEGHVVTIETDRPFMRRCENLSTGETVGIITGPTRHKMDVECEGGMIIQGLPCAGMNFNLGMRVRVTCEIA